MRPFYSLDDGESHKIMTLAHDVATLNLVHIIRYSVQNGQSSLVIPHLLLCGR